MKQLIAHRLGPESHPILIDRMREIYNCNIPFFTKPLAYLTRQDQMDWWRALDHSTNIVHVYSPMDAPWDVCAFSKVTDRGDHCTPLFAVGGAWWGRNFGREIIAHYISLAGDKPLRGEQLASNKAICHLNEEAGWQVLGTENGIQRLFHPGSAGRLQECLDEIIRYHDQPNS